MKILTNLAVGNDGHCIEFMWDIGDNPIPREGEDVRFEADLVTYVDTVAHFVRRHHEPPFSETWIYLEIGAMDAKRLTSVDKVREILSRFPAISFDTTPQPA